MGKEQQLFTIAATPRERFFLARMLLNKNLKFKDRQKEKSLYKARRALGLLTISEQIAMGSAIGTIWRDNTNASAFTVTDSDCDFVLTTIAELERDPGESLMLAEMLERLEAKADSEGVNELPAYNALAEDPRWRSTLEPFIDDPGKLLDLLRDALAHQSYGAFRDIMVAVLDPPKSAGQGDGMPLTAIGNAGAS